MADNVAVTAGAGTSIKTDQVGSDHFQVVKLADGTADSSAIIAVDVGVKANAIRTAPASDITDGTYIGDIKFGEAETNSAAILSDTTDIKTAVELIDNAVDGNYLNTNMNIAGTDVVGGAGVLAAGVQRVTIATDDEVNNLLGTIDADTGAIKTAVELLDNAIDGAYLNVNLNVAGTDVAAGEGAISAQTQRVTLATDDDGVAHLATIAGDTTSLDTKVTACNTGAVVIAAGTASIGKLATNTGVDIGDVDVTSVVPGAGATNLGKARDVACGANDVGVMALAVRDDALEALTPVDGDYVPLRVSSTGALHVTGAGGGTQYPIDDVLGATDTVTLAGVVRDDSLTTLTEADGDVSVLRVSSTGALHVTGGGGGTEYTEDVATANPIVGTATMMERDDALAGLTPAEGDWASLRCDANGALWTHDDALDACIGGTELQVDVVAALPAGDNNIGNIDIASGTITTVSTVTNLSQMSGTAISMDEGAIDGGCQRVTLATDDDGVAHLATIAGAVSTQMQCDVVAALPAGDNNIGNVDIVGGTITTVTTCSTVTNLAQLGGTAISMNEGVLEAGVQRVTLATDDDGVAHLGTIAGDTTNIETAVQIMDDWDAVHASAASSDGPQIMGAAYSTGLPTDVGADADAARICTDRYGRVLAGLMPQNFQATFTSADASSAAPVKVKTADRKMYILSLTVSTDTALNVQFQDDTGPTVLIENLYLAANGGAHLTWPPEAPLVVNTNEDFDIIASGAGNVSCTITGYLAV